MLFSIIIAEVAVANRIRDSLSDDPPEFKVAPRYFKVFTSYRSSFLPCTFLHSYHYF